MTNRLKIMVLSSLLCLFFPFFVNAQLQVKLDLGEGVVMDFIRIRAGSFMMGESPGDASADSSEKPAHQVTISRDFYIGMMEVTVGQWGKLMESDPSIAMFPELPVTKVKWIDAVMFCEKLSERVGKKFRLPTEAEWEYSARAGTTTKYYWGDTFYDTNVWYFRNSSQSVHEVGQKRPNNWFLFDVTGNVWEWCSDWDGPYTSDAVTDPQGPEKGGYRVLRGGSYNDSEFYLRISYRSCSHPEDYDKHIGFRVVLEIDDGGAADGEQKPDA